MQSGASQKIFTQAPLPHNLEIALLVFIQALKLYQYFFPHTKNPYFFSHTQIHMVIFF